MTIANVRKEDGGEYVCLAKNLLNKDSAAAQITVIEELKFILIPPMKVIISSFSDVKLNCSAKGAVEISWKRSGQSHLPNHILYPNGTLVLKSLTSKDAGTYVCVARNIYRSIEANTLIEVIPRSCSDLKSSRGGNSSGDYIIDPDGKGEVTAFSVYCDMSIKGRVGVTIIGHDSESRILLLMLDVLLIEDVTVKMCDTLESALLSWQHSLASHRTVNSLSSLSAIMTSSLWSKVMRGGCPVMEHG